MAKVTLISAVKHDGKDYKPDTFEGDKKIVDELIRAGAAQDPSTVIEQTSAVETAEDEAKPLWQKLRKPRARSSLTPKMKRKPSSGKRRRWPACRSRKPRRPSLAPRPKLRSSSKRLRTPLRRLQTQRPTHLRSRSYDAAKQARPPDEGGLFIGPCEAPTAKTYSATQPGRHRPAP